MNKRNLARFLEIYENGIEWSEMVLKSKCFPIVSPDVSPLYILKLKTKKCNDKDSNNI